MTRRPLAAVAVGAVLALAACSSSQPATAPVAAASTPTSTSSSSTPTPTAIWPLTGLPAASGVAARPALIVKIDNLDAARPQVGVNSADIVFEEPVEGGLTRLAAVFQSTIPATVGPIRSARPVDGQLARLLGGGALLFSGASAAEIAPVRAASHAVLVAQDFGAAPSAFRRDPRRPPVHNLLASPTTALAWGYAHGLAKTTPSPVFSYGPATTTGTAATGIHMRIIGTTVDWAYSPSQNAWLRSQNGTPDATADGGRIRATNVVVVSVRVRYSSAIRDVLRNPTPVFDITGGGSAWVYRDGTMVSGTWSRSGLDVPFSLTTATGPIALAPGTTWVEFIPRPETPVTR